MDPPDERVTALKKAYAEILLNTAKEEAARILASERKAQRFEHELKLAKEEALRMLLRIKHMMDAKVSEAELTSLTQQKKIEELEAQLQEAEDIVRDLREELGEVQSELEKATNEKVQHLNNQYIPTQEQISEVNRLYTSQLIELHPPELAYFASIYTGNSYRGIPDLPSIISRSKEPEHYRNGCTHRIRACDRNRLDQELSSSVQVSKLRNENIVREDKAGKKIHTEHNHEDENKSNLEKKVVQDESSLPDWSSIKKRKRAMRSRKNRSIFDESPKIDQATNISFLSSHPISAIDDGGSSENPSETSPGLLSEKGESGGTSQNESKLDMSCTDLSTINTEEVVTGKRDSSEVSVSEMNLGKSSSPSGKVELEASETSSRIVNDNRFKYTFQRKRKRQSLITIGQDVSLRNNLSKENASVETHVSDETASLKKSAPLENAALGKSTLEENTSLENNTFGEENGRGTVQSC